MAADMTFTEARAALAKAMQEHGVTLEFTPLARRSSGDWGGDKPRHFSESPVHFACVAGATRARQPLAFEYSAGSAHPMEFGRKRYAGMVAKAQSDDGPKWFLRERHAALVRRIRDAYRPDPVDVVSSLLLDASGDLSSFESWCADCGQDTDSRRALESFLACQRTADWLRRAFGETFDSVAEFAQAM